MLYAVVVAEIHQQFFLFIYWLLGPASYVSGVTVFFAVWFPLVLGMFPIVYELYRHKEGKLQMTLWRIYCAPLLAYAFTILIKNFYLTPRPFASLEIPPAFLVSSDPFGLQSFPSSHTAFFAGLAVTMYFCNPRLGKWFLVGAVLIGVARIGAGVHWPIDIFGGFVVGLALGYIVEQIMRLIWKDRIPKC